MILKVFNQFIYAKQFLQTGVILVLDILASVFSSAIVILLINLLISDFEFSRIRILVWLIGSAVTSF